MSTQEDNKRSNEEPKRPPRGTQSDPILFQEHQIGIQSSPNHVDARSEHQSTKHRELRGQAAG